MDGLSAVGIKQVEKLYEAGVHLGHKKNRLHPKAKKFLYKMEQGVSVIDLTHTVRQLEEAKKFIAAQAKENKVMLVVATKKVVNQFAQELSEKHTIPYISTKWLSGLLTNFQTIIKNVKKLQTYKEDREKGAWDQYVKHERMKLNKHIIKLEKFYKGLLPLGKKPDFLFLVDIKKEKNALIEARASGIPVVAIVDTNSNPDLVDYPIVGNDDSPTSVAYLVSELIETYAKNKLKAKNSNVKATS